MANPAQATLLEKIEDSVATTISERLSQEIVIALVGPVESGVSTAAAFISEILNHQFDYQVAPLIRPSDIIRDEAHRVGITPPSKSPLSDYIQKMQTAGNKLRKKYGGNYLAEKAVEKIVSFRRTNGGYSSTDVAIPGRRAYVIDSLKNLDELASKGCPNTPRQSRCGTVRHDHDGLRLEHYAFVAQAAVGARP